MKLLDLLVWNLGLVLAIVQCGERARACQSADGFVSSYKIIVHTIFLEVWICLLGAS
ncbi:hypothetical protein C5167_031202 [Papaver somniferum]|nr:hypothetical protein C5167_031202 [Papaver somniferum]